jgi:hypothetical protein
MDKESARYRSIYLRYVTDNGWDVPKEVVEVIDLRVKESWKDALDEIKRQHDLHKGQWLTEEVAKCYQNKVRPYLLIGNAQYIHFVRELGLDLQMKYGVTEIEAFNILTGYNISGYVSKYYRIKNLIPRNINVEYVCQEVLEEYGFLEEAI